MGQNKNYFMFYMHSRIFEILFSVTLCSMGQNNSYFMFYMHSRIFEIVFSVTLSALTVYKFCSFSSVPKDSIIYET